jgi:SAM-dependent methyltransferase
VWYLLSQSEREQIAAGNLFHNTHRDDFADPSRYRDGADFDAPIADAGTLRRAQELRAFLDRVRPAIVLEVGPGSGQLTRIIAEHPAVHRYVGLDVNPAFIDYLRPRLQQVSKDGFSFDLLTGTTADLPADLRVDAAILLATVHHIPDREGLLADISARLRAGGRVLAIDPTHYVLRWWHLARKLRRPGYAQHTLDLALRRRLSTHAMCSLDEYRTVTARAGLRIARLSFDDRPRSIERLRRWHVPLGPVARWMAQEITIELQRSPKPASFHRMWWERMMPAAVKAMLALQLFRGKYPS